MKGEEAALAGGPQRPACGGTRPGLTISTPRPHRHLVCPDRHQGGQWGAGEACLGPACPTEEGGRPGWWSTPRGIRGGSQVELAQLSGFWRGRQKDSGWQKELRVRAASPEGLGHRAGTWLLATWLLALIPSLIWRCRDLLSHSFNEDILTSVSAKWGSTTRLP